MDKKFTQHCPQCGRYMGIKGHHVEGNEFMGMMYTHSQYFCSGCRLYVPIITPELAFTYLEEVKNARTEDNEKRNSSS